MIHVLAGAFGFLGALAAHDLAAQSLLEQPLRPLVGTCLRCGERRGWLRATCAACGRPIGREIVAALVGAALGVGFANTIGAEWTLLAYLGFGSLTLALALTDIDAFRIVDRLNLRGTVFLIGLLGLAALAEGTEAAFTRGLLGGLAYVAGTNLVFLIAKGQGFGFGDVKLSAQLGVFTAYISWGTLGWSVFLTALVGGLLSLLILGAALGRRNRSSNETGQPETVRDAMRTELPYGPAMIMGAWVAIVLAGLGAYPVPT